MAPWLMRILVAGAMLLAAPAFSAVCRGAEGSRLDRLDNTPNALDALAAQIKANYQAIRTWWGTYRSEYKEVYDAKSAEGFLLAVGLESTPVKETVTRRSTTRGEFAIDFTMDNLFSSMRRDGPIAVEIDGRPPIPAKSHMHERSIVTPEHYVHLEPDRSHDNGTFMGLEDWKVRTGRVAFRDPAEEGRNEMFGQVIDPRKFMWIGGKEPWGDYLATWATLLRKPDTSDAVIRTFSVARDGTKEPPAFRVWIGGHQEIVFDGAVSFNPVSLVQYEPNSDKKLVSRWKWEYRKQAGVYVPALMRLINYTPDGKSVRSDWTWTLLESRVNEPIAPSVFSYRQLGLKDGERVIDRIENVGYVYRDGKLTEPKKMDVRTLPKQTRVPRDFEEDLSAQEVQRWQFIVGANAAALLLIGGYLGVRAIRRKAKRDGTR